MGRSGLPLRYSAETLASDSWLSRWGRGDIKYLFPSCYLSILPERMVVIIDETLSTAMEDGWAVLSKTS